ncbi:hypothetical protein RRG08_005908 [Elysia crispata]|uniref:Uncharacterized protein n=1 Tax=Elysia crispata TaxID=231223 RepID=A0AAE1CSL8_9GAST|nr:hypothetical protein RRG08_005908 [Elysia crispata]
MSRDTKPPLHNEPDDECYPSISKGATTCITLSSLRYVLKDDETSQLFRHPNQLRYPGYTRITSLVFAQATSRFTSRTRQADNKCSVSGVADWTLEPAAASRAGTVLTPARVRAAR